MKFAIVITCKPFPAIRYVHVVSTLGTYTHVYIYSYLKVGVDFGGYV